MPLWLVRFGNEGGRGSGISTTCYPSPAPIHGSLSSDKERLKLCPRVQTPAPVLGRLHATVPGILAVLVVHHPGMEIALQPPASDQPSQLDPDGLTQTRWWVSNHSVTWGHVRFLRLRPVGDVRLNSHSTAVAWAAESNSHPLHHLGHNALFCRLIPTQGLILLLC